MGMFGAETGTDRPTIILRPVVNPRIVGVGAWSGNIPQGFELVARVAGLWLN